MSATRIPNQSQHANAGDVTSTRESNTIEWNNSENFEILRDNSNNHHVDQVNTLENADTQQSDSISNRGITDIVAQERQESQIQSQNQVRFQNQTTEIIIRDNQNTNQNQQSRLDSTRATQTLSC